MEYYVSGVLGEFVRWDEKHASALAVAFLIVIPEGNLLLMLPLLLGNPSL
jgi:hypothetical protein